MENEQSIQPCPICERLLEEPFKGLLSCYWCMVSVDPATGEVTRKREQPGIIKKIANKLKSFLWL